MQAKLLLLSIACATLGAGLLKYHVDDVTQAAWGGAPVEILVLTEDLQAGIRLTSQQLGVAPRPERYVETRHVHRTKLEAVLGLPLGAPVKAGEALLWSDLAGVEAEPRRLSGLVPEGSRAMPINVDHGGFSGLVRPGDRVDVLTSTTGNDVAHTRTLLQNMLVLAVGADTGGPGSRAVGHAGRVTLNVTPVQSETLATAELRGRLRLSLRNPADSLVHGVAHAQ